MFNIKAHITNTHNEQFQALFFIIILCSLKFKFQWIWIIYAYFGLGVQYLLMYFKCVQYFTIWLPRHIREPKIALLYLTSTVTAYPKMKDLPIYFNKVRHNKWIEWFPYPNVIVWLTALSECYWTDSSHIFLRSPSQRFIEINTYVKQFWQRMRIDISIWHFILLTF